MKTLCPRRLDVRDLPRDRERVLGGLRKALCASFNYCRKYPSKLAHLKIALTYVVSRITEYQEMVAAEGKVPEAVEPSKPTVQETIAAFTNKQLLDEYAGNLAKINLDQRTSIEDMKEDLLKQLVALKTAQTKGA